MDAAKFLRETERVLKTLKHRADSKTGGGIIKMSRPSASSSSASEVHVEIVWIKLKMTRKNTVETSPQFCFWCKMSEENNFTVNERVELSSWCFWAKSTTAKMDI